MQNNNVKYWKKFFIYVTRKDGKQQHHIHIFVFQRQRRYIRSGKSTVKGEKKKHKMQHIVLQNIEPSTKPNLRYCTVYVFRGRVYCGRSQWKRKNAKLSEAKQSYHISNFICSWIIRKYVANSKKAVISLVLLISVNSLGNILKSFV